MSSITLEQAELISDNAYKILWEMIIKYIPKEKQQFFFSFLDKYVNAEIEMEKFCNG